MLYIEMAYTKKSATRKIYKKKTVRKFTKSNKSLVALIKKVSLKPVETKSTHHIDENIQLYHNVPYIIYDNLNTTQSITDTDTTVSNFACRVGDEVIARGLSYKFWFANKLDRPNVMYKITFFKYRSGVTPSAGAPYYTQGSANYMIRDLDVEKYQILKTVKFNCQTGMSARTNAAGDPFVGAEAHKAISVWIPLKNQKIKYENGTSTPRFIDYAFTIACYDSYGTLTTDNIASFAVNRKFYFKDP